MTRNTLLIALGISLVLNLVLVGFTVGRLSAGQGMWVAGPDPAFGIFRTVHDLSPERRAELRPLMRDHFKSMRPRLQDIRANHQALLEALSAEPFDPEVLERRLEEARLQLMETQVASHEALVGLASRLDREERSRLAQAFHRPPGHPPHRGGPHGVRTRPDPSAPDAESAAPDADPR